MFLEKRCTSHSEFFPPLLFFFFLVLTSLIHVGLDLCHWLIEIICMLYIISIPALVVHVPAVYPVLITTADSPKALSELDC